MEELNIRTFGERIIIKPDEDTTSKGDLVLSERNITDASSGTVVAIGEDVKGIDVGDKLFYAKNNLEEFLIKGEDYGILPFSRAFYVEL